MTWRVALRLLPVERVALAFLPPRRSLNRDAPWRCSTSSPMLDHPLPDWHQSTAYEPLPPTWTCPIKNRSPRDSQEQRLLSAPRRYCSRRLELRSGTTVLTCLPRSGAGSCRSTSMGHSSPRRPLVGDSSRRVFPEVRSLSRQCRVRLLTLRSIRCRTTRLRRRLPSSRSRWPSSGHL